MYTPHTLLLKTLFQVNFTILISNTATVLQPKQVSGRLSQVGKRPMRLKKTLNSAEVYTLLYIEFNK